MNIEVHSGDVAITSARAEQKSMCWPQSTLPNTICKNDLPEKILQIPC